MYECVFVCAVKSMFVCGCIICHMWVYNVSYVGVICRMWVYNMSYVGV